MAQAYRLTATLTGAQEVPPRMTSATGFGTVTFNPFLNTLTVNESWTGLTTPATGAHIHCCAAPGATGPVAVDFVPNGFPVGTTGGTYVHTFNLLASSTYGSAFLTAQGSVLNARNTVVAGLLAGTTYLNIHTATFPPGEIRGQLVNLTATPEPGTWALMITGLLAVGGVAHRRRRTS